MVLCDADLTSPPVKAPGHAPGHLLGVPSAPAGGLHRRADEPADSSAQSPPLPCAFSCDFPHFDARIRPISGALVQTLSKIEGPDQHPVGKSTSKAQGFPGWPEL